jgi:hypothetical protein
VRLFSLRNENPADWNTFVPVQRTPGPIGYFIVKTGAGDCKVRGEMCQVRSEGQSFKVVWTTEAVSGEHTSS